VSRDGYIPDRKVSRTLWRTAVIVWRIDKEVARRLGESANISHPPDDLGKRGRLDAYLRGVVCELGWDRNLFEFTVEAQVRLNRFNFIRSTKHIRERISILLRKELGTRNERLAERRNCT